MFDAKSLLEALVRGASPQPAQTQGGLGGLAEVLGRMLQQGQGAAGATAPGRPAGGGLDDLLRQLTQTGPSGQGGAPGGLGDLLRNILPGAQGQPGGSGQGGGPGGGLGGLGDILANLQKQIGQQGQAPGAQSSPGGQPQGGGLLDVLGQILGQATSGVREGAQRVDEATGIGRQARDAFGQVTGGRSPDEVIRQIQEWIANNPGTAAAGAGGLGAIVLGTRTGRSVAASAAKLGALVLIGGLAYKAYQNYAAGRPVLSGAGRFEPEQAPQGSGFEPDAVTNESAALYIRAMIAAAAADGRIDPEEQQTILGGLKQAGLDAQAEEFLANELNNPATVDDLAAAVSSPEEAVQVYTAARIAVNVDSAEEHAFLATLASRLGLEPGLVQHIDATARGA